MPPLPLSVQLAEDFDAAGVTREEWDAAVLAAGGDVYSSWDWCQTWWRHYGRGRRLRLFLFREGERLACVLAMFTETVLLGPCWLRVAKLLGSDFTSCVSHPPLPRERASEIVRLVVERLVTEDGCDAVRLGPLGGHHPALETIREACEALAPLATLVGDTAPGPHTVFDLPPDYDAYMRALKRKPRSNLRRYLKRLEEGREVRVDVVRDGELVQSEFERFVRMHGEQWRAAGMLGHFGDWPGSIAYHRDLVTDAAGSGRLRLVRLFVDGEVVSYQLGFAFGRWLYWRLPARAMGETWNLLGLGRIGLVQMIEVALEEGVRHIEAGAGHYDYKLRHGGVEHESRTFLVVASRPGSRLRARIFSGAARLLHLVYYRVWFQRIAPRLPLPRRPLWRSWIRSRP